MKVAFAGSHEISWFCLRVIAELCREHGDEVAAAFNLRRDAGEKHSAFVEFDALESEYGFAHHRVRSLSAPDTLALLRELRLDVLFVIGWHRIVPQEVIDVAPLCVGMHSSLLPKDRGSAPVNWAIMRGDRAGGMTFFHMTTGVDSGDIIDQEPFTIAPRDTCRDVYDRATVAAATLLRRNWADLRTGSPRRLPQDEAQATYNGRRRPEDGVIDWSAPTADIDAFVRALTHPYPGAFTTAAHKKLLIWKADPSVDTPPSQPGRLLGVGDAIRVATGDGALDVLALQYEGEPECSARVFSSVYQPMVGDHWGGAVTALR